MSKPRLTVIIGSTRPGRVGPSVADWFRQRAIAEGGFEVDLVDLADVALPLLDEPHHPKLGRYVHEHTKAWSATIDRADAIVWVMPEYNHSFNAAMKNAIDYLHQEWPNKPVGLVSYGGVAAGTRAVQALKPVLAALKMVPLVESVNIPFVHSLIKDGQFDAPDSVNAGADVLLGELVRWTAALQPLRELTEQLAS
ncbi:MAG: NADPH-dependent reductase [Pseudonocardiales bacterium]|nr:NADPH-dependent reductase [Pseudonocardiales bacterium]